MANRIASMRLSTQNLFCVRHPECSEFGSSAMADLGPAIILDNGSGHIKAGLAGDEVPSVVLPAVVGRPKHDGVLTAANDKKSLYVGEEATQLRGVLKLNYAVEHGVVKEWTDMERIWKHVIYDQLRVNPEEHPVVVTEAPFNPKRNREKMVELLFEKFGVPGMYVVIQAVMSLYAAGRTTGMVVDSGDGVTHTVPIFEGFAMPHAIQRLNLAGRDVTEYAIRVFTEGGNVFESSSEKDIVRDMKEKMCYVAQDYDEEMKDTTAHTTYTLPDGTEITMGNERIRIPEVLFNPMMYGKEMMGIHTAAYKAVTDCDIDTRRAMLHNVILSGGNSMFPGMKERLEKELRALAPPKLDVKVIANPERRWVVFIGASIVAQLSSFPDMLVLKKEYDEVGADIVHRKCF